MEENPLAQGSNRVSVSEMGGKIRGVVGEGGQFLAQRAQFLFSSSPPSERKGEERERKERCV